MPFDLCVFVQHELHVLLRAAAVVDFNDKRFAVVTDGRNLA